jgi:carboxyl-terminal processing protease
MPLRNVIIIAVSIVISMACYSAASKNRYANLFAEAMDLVDTQALREVPRKELFNSAMKGMLKQLDEHSMFISGDDYKNFDEDMRQEFGGVGMYVENNPVTKRLFVLAPIPGTPAFEAGLQVGDVIIEIDGVSTESMSRADAVDLLRGPVNEPVELVVERDEVRTKKRLVRAAIQVASVNGDFRNPDGSWQFTLNEHPRIGYIRLQQFGEKSATEIADALATIEDKTDGVVLDLRNNSGGLLNVAIQICDYFVNKGEVIVSTKGRNGKLIRDFNAAEDPIVKADFPVVVLINRNSASASEIVAGCLQDHNSAVVVGEQSWGKGTVQDVIPMQRGESALKLTTRSYWRPSGKEIDRYSEFAKQTKVWGVQPNRGFSIVMTEEEVFDNLRHRSIRDLEGLMPPGNSATLNALKKIRLQPADPAPDETPLPDDDNEANTTEIIEDDGPHVDRPLQRAIEYFQALFNQRQIAA